MSGQTNLRSRDGTRLLTIRSQGPQRGTQVVMALTSVGFGDIVPIGSGHMCEFLKGLFSPLN